LERVVSLDLLSGNAPGKHDGAQASGNEKIRFHFAFPFTPNTHAGQISKVWSTK